MASGGSSVDNSKESRWYFTVEQLQNSPSRRQGIDAEKEIGLRQQAAYLIQEMGQKLRVNQLCINTAIVYMHRFYAFHSFTQFHHYGIAMASLFLAAKVEEQPRKLESVIQVSQSYIPAQEGLRENYQEQAQDLVFNENILLQTLGFDVAVDHPHTHVVRTCQLVKACKDLAQISYFLASNSLHLTTMCLQYKPTEVACFCIYLACKWSRWEIPTSNEGKEWFYYVDKSVTMDMLERLTDEFLAIHDRSPTRLKNKLTRNYDLTHNARPSDSHTSGSQHRSSSHHRSSSSSHHQLKQQSTSTTSSTSLHSSSQSGRHHRNERDRNTQPDRPANVPPRTSSSSNGPIPARNTNNNPMRPQSISSREMQRNADSTGHHRSTSSTTSSHHQQMKQRPTAMHSSNTNTNNNSSNSNNTNNNATNQQKQQMLSVQNSQQKPQPTLIDMSSFGGDISAQLDDINTMDLLNSPPKQQQQMKPPSIFSPEWNDKSNSSNNGSNLLGRMDQQQGSNGSEAHDSIHSNDPIKKEKINDQHHQQTHRTSMQTSDKMLGIKREMSSLSNEIQYDTSLPHNLLDNKAIKRPYNSEQMQSDVNECQQRDVKMRKVEPLSPTLPNLSDQSAKLGLGTKSFGASTMNSIETSTDMVSSLLKQSLNENASKYGAPTVDTITDKKLTTANMQDMNLMAGYNVQTSNMDQQQKQQQQQQQQQPHPKKLDAFDQAMSTQYSNQHMQYNKHMDTDITNQSQRMLQSQKWDEQQFDSSQPQTCHQKLMFQQQPDQQQLMYRSNRFNNSNSNSNNSRPDSNELNSIAGTNELQQQQQLPAQLIVKSDSAERIKSEKKKKKEKHKNKDKEKTKNRDERKKHKKDKDRSKDKSKMQQSGHSISEMPNNTEPIRITIAKDKLNLSQTDHHNASSGYSRYDAHNNLNDGTMNASTQQQQQQLITDQQIKLKIPKDRIKTDPQMNLNAMNHNTVQAPQPTTSTPTSLKIKIPKDVIENYANTSQQNYSNETGHPQATPSKKKDKNRDRDKSMRNSSSNMPNSTKMLSQNDQSHQSHTVLAQSIFADERDRESIPEMWGQHKLTQQQIQNYQQQAQYQQAQYYPQAQYQQAQYQQPQYPQAQYQQPQYYQQAQYQQAQRKQ